MVLILQYPSRILGEQRALCTKSKERHRVIYILSRTMQTLQGGAVRKVQVWTALNLGKQKHIRITILSTKEMVININNN